VRRAPTLAWVAVLAIALAPPLARAGGNNLPTLGNEAAISGGAVVAAGRGGSMAWYNPAGLGANRHGRIEASAQLFMVRLRRLDGGLVTDLPDGSHSASIKSRELLVLPSSTVWILRVAPRASLALSLFVPSFDEVDIDTFAQRRNAPIQYAQQIKVLYQQRRYDVGPSFGIELLPSLRIGFGAYVVYDKTVESSRAWAWGNAEAQKTERFLQTDLYESVRSWGAELVAGLQWQPTDYLHLGFAVRSPRLWFAQKSTRSTVAASGGRTPTEGEYSDLSFVPTLRSGLTRPNDPITATAGLAYQWRTGSVALEADVSPGRRGGDDDGARATWGARLGARGRVARNVSLGGGVYHQRSPLVVANDFLDFDVDTWGFTLGGELRRPVTLGKRERAHRLVFTTVVGVRYALQIGHAGRMRIDLHDLSDQHGDVLIPSGAPVPARLHDFALQLGSGLEF
jgi:hypothetical protein